MNDDNVFEVKEKAIVVTNPDFNRLCWIIIWELAIIAGLLLGGL